MRIHNARFTIVRTIVSLTTLRDRKDSIQYFTINRNDKFPRRDLLGKI